MPRTILVGVDGSAHGASALEFGIDWAKKSNALLVGLGIIDEPEIIQPVCVPPAGPAHQERRNRALLTDARRKVESYLQQFAIRCADAGVACKLLEDVGLPWEQIMLEAQRYDLIALGQESHFAFETQRGADDTLEEVVRRSPRPVVVVPIKPAAGTTIVLAYDGSLQAARAMQAFAAVGPKELPVHVVSVLPDRIEAARCASRAVDFLAFHGINATVHAVGSSKKPGPEILKQARELEAALVVMGSYGQSAWKEFCFGSVTRTMLSESNIPLFLNH
jgi:nucleotide-binding universal stress UspA family protein